MLVSCSHCQVHQLTASACVLCLCGLGSIRHGLWPYRLKFAFVACICVACDALGLRSTEPGGSV